MLATVPKHPVLYNIDKVKGQPKNKKEKKKRVNYQEMLNTLTSSFAILPFFLSIFCFQNNIVLVDTNLMEGLH